MAKKLNTVLNKNGYVVLKKELTSEQKIRIEKDLYVEPQSVTDFGGEIVKFKVWQETETSYILPRYYGVSKFGQPKVVDQPYKAITAKFKGELRDYQKPIMEDVHAKILAQGGGLMKLPCAYGKCLSAGTLVMMFDGTFKKVEDIKVGEQIMGDDSTVRNILSLARGKEEMFDIIPIKGDKYTVNRSHILSLKSSTNHSKEMYKGAVIDISVDDYLKLPKMFHGKGTPLRGYRVPINFPEQQIILDSYMFGYWLGDGDSDKALITTEDAEVVQYYQEQLKNMKLSLKQGVASVTTRHELHYKITTGICTDHEKKIWTNNDNSKNKFYQELKNLNVLNNKHIPDLYKHNSRQVRLEILAGIIDSDGHLRENGKNSFDITLVNEKLLDDIIYIARSLGFSAYKSKCQKTCTNGKNGPVTGTYYRTCISGDTIQIPVKLPRKKAVARKQIKNVLVYGIEVKSVGMGDYYGFEIDGNKRFVLGDFTVTHNTSMAIHEALRLGGKTLIIVAKSFLMNQWIDRIEKFTDAKIGIIRCNKIDVKNKDIVVAMLQSLCARDYDENIFADFSTLIVDEAHHISSRIFHTALFKTAFKYTIALSATPKRSDGLTKIMHWFLGDTLCDIDRKKDSRIVVKTFMYESTHANFTEKKIWIPAKKKTAPNIAKMHTLLTEIPDRNKFLVDIINTLRAKKERKILILSHRIEHLVVLKKEVDICIKRDELAEIIEKDEIKTHMYYSKTTEAERRDAETYADILFSTFAMAEEGLDIERLNTVILATPKKKIEQSVGRIMRKVLKKGDTDFPIIIDIYDNYSAFANWGEFRDQYYKKYNYFISQIYAINSKALTKKEFHKIKYDVTDAEVVEQFNIKDDYDANLDVIFTINQDQIDQMEKMNLENEESNTQTNLNAKVKKEEYEDCLFD